FYTHACSPSSTIFPYTTLFRSKWQFKIASGEPLTFSQADITQSGHAIECRIYAEDARNHFLPSVGRVQMFIPPMLPGVRVDSGIDRKSTRLNSSHVKISYAVFC